MVGGIDWGPDHGLTSSVHKWYRRPLPPFPSSQIWDRTSIYVALRTRIVNLVLAMQHSLLDELRPLNGFSLAIPSLFARTDVLVLGMGQSWVAGLARIGLGISTGGSVFIAQQSHWFWTTLQDIKDWVNGLQPLFRELLPTIFQENSCLSVQALVGKGSIHHVEVYVTFYNWEICRGTTHD